MHTIDMRVPYVRVRVVESETVPGTLSIRPVQNGEVVGKAGTFRKMLSEAGFKIGDEATLILSGWETVFTSEEDFEG
jgi:hypothetical protein